MQRRNSTRNRFGVVALVAVLFASCDAAVTEPPPSIATTIEPFDIGAIDDIVTVAGRAASLDTFLAAVDAAGLTETLADRGPFTVFAPTDDAFLGLLDGTLAGLFADSEALRELLESHIVPGELVSADLAELDSVPTLQGSELAIGVDLDEIILNESAQVISTDIEASNGVIHVIDRVLAPAPTR